MCHLSWYVKLDILHNQNQVSTKPLLATINSLQKKLVVLTTEWLPQLQTSCGYESFTLVLETN